VDFLVPCTTVTAFSAYIFPIYTHTTNCKRKRERRSGGASLTPSGMHAMRATTLETCAIPHARPCRAASGCTRHDANKTHAVATLQRRAREDMIVQAEPNTMLPELEFEREHRVKMITEATAAACAQWWPRKKKGAALLRRACVCTGTRHSRGRGIAATLVELRRSRAAMASGGNGETDGDGVRLLYKNTGRRS